ncbi:MAG TPA: hypothetical protein VF141_14890 [Chryseolinea sp.]
MKRLPYISFLIVAGLFACNQKETNKISVKVSPQEVLIDGRKIEVEKFQSELKKIIDDKVKTGYKKDELVIRMAVNSRTKRGMLADIEVAMRKLNVRRVEYSTSE